MMAMRPTPVTAAAPPRRSEETLSGRSSNSQVSTDIILSRFPNSLGIRSLQRADNLQVRLNNEEFQPVTTEDTKHFEHYRGRLMRILASHTSKEVLDNVTVDAKMKGNEKVVVIGCKTKKVQKTIDKWYGDRETGAMDFVRNSIGFHDVVTNSGFTGHLVWKGPSSALVHTKAAYTTFSSLGLRLSMYGGETMTMGGVILLDGRPYGLTTGCAISRRHRFPTSIPITEEHMSEEESRITVEFHESEVKRIAQKEDAPIENEEDMDSSYILRNTFPGRITVYMYPGVKRIRAQQLAEERYPTAQTPKLPSAEFSRNFQTFGSVEGTDWALVEILDEIIPPNGMLNLADESSDEWLWTDKEDKKEVLAQSIISESDLIYHMTDSRGYVKCLTYAPTPSPIPGFIAPGKSTIVMDGAIFSVLEVHLSSPLKYGHSGSWVLVGNAVCGVIIAGSRGYSDSDSIQTEESEMQAFSAYMIPITKVFDSISQTLSAKVTLPTLVDYRIDFLQKQRRATSYTTATPHPRYLDMELLLGQKRQQERGHRTIEKLEVQSMSNDPSMSCLFSLKVGWPYRFVLEDMVGLHYETIYRLLPLGEICPLSAVFRPGFRQWARDYRKSRFQNRRSFVCTIIIDRCLQTEAGENLLGLLIFLWRIEREPSQTGKRTGNARSHRIAWLAQLLSVLYGSMKISKTAIPSTEQLHIFIYCVVSAFKDKDLKHLYLIQDAAYRVRKATPSGNFLLSSLPSRQNAVQRAWKAVSAWTSGKDEEDVLLDANSALSKGPESPMSWNHTVASTAYMLVTLHNIYKGDRSRVLVYSGLYSTWVGFYASLVLGLEIQLRERRSDGTHLAQPLFGPSKHIPKPDADRFREKDSRKTGSTPSPFGRSKHIPSPDADVIIYRTTLPWKEEEICEIIDRNSITSLHTSY